MKWLKIVAILCLGSLAFAQKTQVNSLNNVRYTDTYYWQRYPNADLSVAGTGKTITLPSGILGIDVSATATKPQYIYIDVQGTPEAALITGGTYTSAAGGTVIVTTANTHAAGYRVGSATSGIQEALNDAGTPMSRVVIAPSKGKGPAGNAWPVYAPIILQNNQTTLEGDGTALNCFTRSRCIQVGSLANALSFGGNTIRGLRFGSSVATSSVAITNTACSSNTATITVSSTAGFVTGDVVDVQYTGRSDYWGGNVGANNGITVTSGTTFTFPKTGCSIPSEASGGWAALQNSAIEDNINGLNMENLFFSTPGGITGKFNNGIVIDNDQAAKITGMNVAGDLHCKVGSVAQYCGNYIYAPGPFATNASVIYVNKANLSINCAGNGINNLAGNTLSVSDSVIQGYSQFGINTGTLKGGFGPTTISNVYEEIGACSNFNYPGTGTQLRAQTGVMAWGGGFTDIRGGEAPLGQIPKFAATGNNGTQYNYYVVVKDTTEGTSGILPVGYATVDSSSPSGSITVSWPRVQGTATVTYDVLRNSGAGNSIIFPYNGGCTGGSTTACGSIATAQAQCSTFLCSFTDTASTSTTSYTVTAQNYYPKLNFWPGALVLTTPTDVKTDTSVSVAYIDGTEFLTGTTPIVSSYGVAAPSVMAQRCDISTPGVWVSCLTGNSSGSGNPAVVGTLFQNGPANSGGITANLKGRLNILNNPSIAVNTGDLFTFVDSKPEKTLNSPYYRPTNDANDTAACLDNGNVNRASAQLCFRAPISISNYIASVGDGTNWVERLTSSLKTFKVPITTNSDFTMTSGVFNIAASTKSVPMQTGAGAPSGANCTINGQQYFRTDGTLGQQVYYCNGSGTWTLQTGGGGSGAWDAISSPGANQSLNMANFSSTWTGSTALTNPLLTITDTTGNTFTGFLEQITAAGTSTAKGLGVTVAAGGTAGQFQAGATGIAINIPTGQGYIKGDRFVSTSANAATTGCVLCLGTTDSVTYRNSGTASTMTLIQAGDSGPVHVGDTPGVDFAGTLTSRSAGQSMSMQPQAASGSGNGGDLTFTTGSGAGTGAPGNIHLLPGSGVANSGGGLIDAGTSGWSVKVTNDAAQPPTVNGPVCLTSSGNAKQCDTGTAAGAIGICMANCTNTGSSTITHTGWAIATFDGAPVTSGHYFSVSTTAGQVTDVGASPNATQEALGVVGSLLSGSNYNVFVFASSPVVSLANVVTTNPASGNVILPTSPTQIPLVAQCNATSSVDCLQVKKPDGTVAFKVDKNGIVTIGTGTGTITATQFLSDSSNIASSAASNKLRLASSDLIAWRNNANTGDVIHGKNNSDYMTFVNSPGLAITQAGASFTTTLTATIPAQNQNLSIPDVGAASDTFTMRDMVQTLTNKKIGDSLSFANLGATPSNPAAGTLKVYSKTDQLCQVTSGGTETCFTAGGGGGSVLSAITAAAGANTISNGDNAQTWNWTLTTASKNAFKFGENAAATNGAGSQYLLNIGTLASSTARPLGVFARGTTNGFFSDNVTGNLTLAGAASFDTSTAGALVVEIPNDGATGTTVNLLCKLTTSNTCIKTTTSDLAGIEGVVIAGAGTSGNAQVARTGVAVCTFSNATTVGDYVGGSGATAGNCLDLGSQPTAGAQILGRVLTAGGAGTSQSVLLGPVGNIPISGTANQVNTAYASGGLTLSTPQDIATSSSPTFSQINSSSSTSSFRSSTNAGDTEFQCGRNASASVTCTATVHGANQTGTGNNGAGHVKVQGGSNASTGTGAAGNVDLQAGQGTAAANANGYIKLSAAYIKGGTYTTDAVVCFSATNTVSDCSTSQLNPIGTAYSSNGNAAIVAEVGSQVGVLYDATVSPSAGWYACLSSITAGKVTAQAGPCIEGRQVGIIEASGSSVTSGKVTLKFGSPVSGPDFVTLTDGATITWAINSQHFANASVTLGGNRTLNITNPVNGGSYVLKVIQDGTGSRGLTLGTGCTWKVSGGGAGAITPSTGANAIDVLTWIYDGTNCLANFNKTFN